MLVTTAAIAEMQLKHNRHYVLPFQSVVLGGEYGCVSGS